MKKAICFFSLFLILWGCGSYRQQFDIRSLTVGMSKAEVNSLVGSPERYLSISRTPYGYEEILQYRNVYNEIYALEFVNDYLVAANYIYDGMYYSMYPPANRPPYGKSVFPSSYKPNRPAPAPPQGSSRPGQNNRPSSNNQTEKNTMPPARPRESTNNNNSNTSRQSSRQDNTSTPASNRESTNSSPRQGSNNSQQNNSRENTQQNNRSTTTNQDSGRESSRQSTSSDRENSNSSNGRR